MINLQVYSYLQLLLSLKNFVHCECDGCVVRVAALDEIDVDEDDNDACCRVKASIKSNMYGTTTKKIINENVVSTIFPYVKIDSSH